MGLLEIWRQSPKQVEQKHIQQILVFAGNGHLRDDSDTCAEFRKYLATIPSNLLSRYSAECLTTKFDDNGLALQDIINEVGLRLGFEVEHGRYRGTTNQIGNDGLWHSPQDRSIVVEVKTTDTYLINLDGIAEYRKKLVESGKLTNPTSSILIVVGRQDTGGLEAQIRGSKHAWDIRLISVEALLRLMRLKEEVENPTSISKICSILIPHEYTRVDGIIDVAFSSVEDVQIEGIQEDQIPDLKTEKKPKLTPVKFHDACLERIQAFLKKTLLRRSRATFTTPDGSVALICTVSRERDGLYWFAFHPHQKEFLSAAKESYVAFGCGSEKNILLIPFDDFKPWIEGFNTTKLEDRFYWHVHIYHEGDQWLLHQKKGMVKIDLSKYFLKYS